jgi:hypothetical protein
VAAHGAKRKPSVLGQSLDPVQPATNLYVPYVAMAGYVGYFLSGLISTLFSNGSLGEALSWQIGSAFAITANVLSGVWLARRGDDLASAGFTMLGIVQCVFFSSIVLTAVDYRLMAIGVLLLVPALTLIAFCTVFPIWVRAAGLLICVLFVAQYVTILRDVHRPSDALQSASFVGVQGLGILWSFHFWREARRAD